MRPLHISTRFCLHRSCCVSAKFGRMPRSRPPAPAPAKHPRTFAFACLLALVACADQPPREGIQDARCHAAGAESVLGRNLDARVIEEAIAGSGALRTRVIRPGSSATTDLDPLRLNIEVDQSGRIRRMVCG